MLDADGKVLARGWFAFVGRRPADCHEHGPKGNVGVPWQPHEVEHFETMLVKAKKHLGDADVAALVASMKEFRKETKAK